MAEVPRARCVDSRGPYVGPTCLPVLHANRILARWCMRRPGSRPRSIFEIVVWSIPVRAPRARCVRPARWRRCRSSAPIRISSSSISTRHVLFSPFIGLHRTPHCSTAAQHRICQALAGASALPAADDATVISNRSTGPADRLRRYDARLIGDRCRGRRGRRGRRYDDVPTCCADNQIGGAVIFSE